MKKLLVILVLLLSVKINAQEYMNVKNNIFQPRVKYTIELYGLTNYHIYDERYDYYNVKLPYGMEGRLGLELSQRHGYLSFKIGLGRNYFNYNYSTFNRDNVISNISLNICYQYFINEKLSLGGKFGLYDSFMVRTKKYKTKHNIEQTSYKDEIYAIDLGVGIEYELNRILTIRFEPYFNYTITNVTTRGVFKEDMVFSPIIGIRLGVKFKLVEYDLKGTSINSPFK